ncbi:MAG: hypothetical protein DMG97_09860 [Acidobacteria bacterium]|nr:MAG: hypothetical protein DMG97_09860 [Acidobacteriota bacterium]
MNGVIYCRVSSKEQIEGTSLESQEAACREYAQSHNIKVLKIFIERGESAKFADRTQLIELIDFFSAARTKERSRSYSSGRLIASPATWATTSISRRRC